MIKQIKLLIVEDNDDDALLIIEQFKLSGYQVDFSQVWTEESMREALASGPWDAITCDHNMPGFDSVRALKLLAASGLDLPFIIVSGSIGEMKAVEVMKAGAHDYVVKGSLERLVTATEREIREAQRRDVYRRTEFSQRFLAEASAILVSSLDYNATLQGILGLVVPKLADCCIIDLIDREGTPSESYADHIDIKKVDQILEIHRRFPLDLNSSVKLTPLIVKLTPYAHDLEYLNILAEFGFDYAMIVPLRVRGKMIGAITFITLANGLKFDEMDLALAEEIAQRSSLAIDNARLYQKSLEEIQRRDDFLVIASHELKTPITSLRLKLQTLLRSLQRTDRGSISDEYIVAALKFSDRQISRFIKLIEELLNVSNITKGELELDRENVNLTDVINELENQFSEELRASGSILDIDVKSPIIGHWDFFRIEQVLGNLLANAIKYGQGYPIKISAVIEGTDAKLTIEDHGLGIPKKDQIRIFERFERAVSSHNYGGLGLGLYIVQQIIEAHGGSILVESEPGMGARFIICIPLGFEQYENIALDGRAFHEQDALN